MRRTIETWSLRQSTDGAEDADEDLLSLVSMLCGPRDSFGFVRWGGVVGRCVDGPATPRDDFFRSSRGCPLTRVVVHWPKLMISAWPPPPRHLYVDPFGRCYDESFAYAVGLGWTMGGVRIVSSRRRKNAPLETAAERRTSYQFK
jgi:hypothetical protein